jgi:nitrite reductase/ring-hydroxylating ferredoxin subunit
MHKIVSCFFVVTLFLFAGCGKESDFVPEVFVNYNVTIQEFNIKAVNKVLLVPNQGVAGLMIVATGTGYVAFDRCSAVNPAGLCKVAPDESGITATDPCTGAKWLLMDGSPQKAPAVRYLKSYAVSVQGGQIIQILN